MTGTGKLKEILNSHNSGVTRQSTFQNDRGSGTIRRVLKFTPSPNLGEGWGEVKVRRFFASLRMTGKKKIAFTLAEVLITLGIIGVVAAMTMPALIAKQQEKEYTAKLKKINSILNQAIQMAITENGEISTWNLSTAGMNSEPTEEEVIEENKSKNRLIDILTPYLKTTYICKYGESCDNEKAYTRYSLDGTEFGTVAPHIVLADGTSIVATTIADPACKRVDGPTKALQNICGEIFVDLNGPKPPNTSGKDLFYFYITKFGVTPQGMPDLTSGFIFEHYCNLTTNVRTNGYGCAAWVIYNENMDYLHCNDLSWNGKKKCR